MPIVSNVKSEPGNVRVGLTLCLRATVIGAWKELPAEKALPVVPERPLREGVRWSNVEGSRSLQKRQSKPSCSCIHVCAGAESVVGAALALGLKVNPPSGAC